MSENRVIGRNGKIPWHLPGDLLRFKELTMHSACIMGRSTYESIGEPLPSRYSYVVTSRSLSSTNRHVKAFGSLELAVSSAKNLHVWIIGGQEIYRQALEELEIEEIYLTVIHEVIEGDTYFPNIPEDKFEIESIEEKEENDTRYSFVKLVRRKESV